MGRLRNKPILSYQKGGSPVRLKNFWKNESGAVAVIVAVFMVVLIGFTALVVDYGYWASTRRDLQNTADAAALAGASKLDGTGEATVLSSAEGEANTFANNNGVDTSDTVVTFPSADHKDVQVTVTRVVDATFSQVLTGRSTQTISATAVASATSFLGDYEYALFGGKTINDAITFNGGSKSTVDGNIHSNSNISMKNTEVNNSVITAVGTAEIGNGDRVIYEHATSLAMPSISSLLSSSQINRINVNNLPEPDQYYTVKKGVMSLSSEGYENLLQYAADNTMDSRLVLFYFDGTVDIQADKNVSFPAAFVASGDITFGGSNIDSSSSSVLLASETGDITFNGGGIAFQGILYAPNGDITLDGTGGSGSITGSVYADTIDRNGNGLDVTYDKNASNFLPLTKVRLVA